MFSFSVVLLLATWSASRPPECVEAGSNVWERAKNPELRSYCDTLASGTAKLGGTLPTVRDAIVLSNEAERLLPGRAAPLVLRGRALERLGNFVLARTVLEQGQQRDARALDDPAVLLAWARVLLRTDAVRDSREAYRLLLPRASALSAPDRVRAALEAGFLALAEGPSSLPEAEALFRQAQHDAQGPSETVAALALALTLHRAGRPEEARVLIGSRPDPRPMLSKAREHLDPAGTLEIPALCAVGLEPREDARIEWQRYASSAKGPWLTHAREAALQRRVPGPRPRAP